MSIKYNFLYSMKNVVASYTDSQWTLKFNQGIKLLLYHRPYHTQGINMLWPTAQGWFNDSESKKWLEDC